MARLTVSEGVATQAASTGRSPLTPWRLTPVPFYLLGFLLVRGDLARLPGSVADLSLHLYFAAMLFYVGAMFFYFAYFAYRRDSLRWLGLVLVVPGAAVHLGAIISRGFADSHYPLANMYEYSSMCALVAVTVFLLMTVRYPVASLGGGLALFVVVALMGVGYGLYQSPEPLVPALQSYWLKIHVSSMMASSGILVSSFVFAGLYLLKDRSGIVRSWLHGSAIAARLPSLETLDRLTFRAILLGFPIWTFGTMAGAIWGEHAWGRWWGWDPKETWAAITWMIYAIYLHAHGLRAWRGRRTALIATAGFISIMVTLYAVNLWIVGLHSYAKGAG
ncbi:MAG: c-type cytochrome biogenesis protein CcsB [Candidatus Dormibacteraeota bacterium]|nr:c-type cytochrome biogenesis protein CcsB [Candidatus Dormibacteraeota bacterium]